MDITQALGQGTINYLADKLFERTRKYFEHLDEFDLDPTRRSETSALLKHLFSRLGVKDLHQALKEAQDQFREVASSSSLPVGLLVKPNPNSHEHQRSVREPVLSYQNNWESEIHGLPADCRTSHPRLSRGDCIRGLNAERVLIPATREECVIYVTRLLSVIAGDDDD